MSAHTVLAELHDAPNRASDPGASGAFNLGNKGIVYCRIRTAAAEDRTIPSPTCDLQRAIVCLDTDTGNATVAISGGQGITSVVLNDAGDAFELVAITVAGTRKWVPAWSSGPLSGFPQVMGGDVTVNGVFSALGGAVFNEDSADVDFRIESNVLSSFLVIDANTCLNGQIAFGGAVPTNPQAFFAILPAVNASGVTANQSYFHATVLPGAAVTIPTGTAPVVASVNLHEPNITATGTVTEAATLRIVDAPTEGGLNAALWVDAGATRLDGTTYIGDSANANITLGLTVNQAANDDQILALKSSDVAHAATGAGGAEADTYGAFLKAEAAAGGLLILGLKDGDGVAGHAVHIRGVLDETAADTTKTTAGIGVVTIDGTLEGTNVPAVLGSDENILVLRSLSTTRHIFDAEGTYHGDEAATTFDEHDDISLVRSFDVTSPKKKGVIKSQWDKFAIENEQKLIDLKILGAPRSEGGLVNFTRLIQLHNGAIWQMYENLMEVASALPDEAKAKMKGRIGQSLEMAGA